jgi:hypothetical protein
MATKNRLDNKEIGENSKLKSNSEIHFSAIIGNVSFNYIIKEVGNMKKSTSSVKRVWNLHQQIDALFSALCGLHYSTQPCK